MTFTPLTREQFEAIPEPMRHLRRANWQRIVRELGADHHARYHAQTEHLLNRWADARRAVA